MNVCVTVLLVAGAYALFSPAASAEETVPYFSNKDIEQYRKTPDADPGRTKNTPRDDRKKAAETAKDKKEQETWCKRANDRKKKIAKAQYDLSRAEKVLAAAKEKNAGSGKKSAKEQDRVDRAKQRLAEEEKELADLEQEAHRKNVPPGWLRCQFD